MSGRVARVNNFIQDIQSLTSYLVADLFSKWEDMYEISDEFENTRLEKLKQYIKDFYDEISDSEEKRHDEMLHSIDKTIREYHVLLKELHIREENDILTMEVETPYTKFMERINDSMQKYKDMRDARLLKLESLRAKEKELCDLLEIEPLPDFPKSIPSEQYLENIDSHIFELSEEKIHRMEIYNESRERILSLMKQMEYEANSDFELDIITSSTFIPSGVNMEKLKDLVQTMEKEYFQKVDYRSSLIDKLTKLWDRINVEEPERSNFLSQYDSVQKSHLQAINKEIVKCEKIKLANIKPIVENLREKIKKYWDLLTMTDEERERFIAFSTDHFSEDVLDLHELELDRLQQFYEKYENIFTLADKRNALWEKMLHLDEIAMDKNRLFNNRGGQLLKEEKERKSLEINLPKVDKQLKAALNEFKSAEGRPFLWHGVDLLERITQEWEARIAEKESKKVARKVENKKLIEEEAKLGSRIYASKRKLGTPLTNVSQAKTRRCDDLGSQTIILKAGMRTPGKYPNIRTPLNVSTASIASYSHFQDGLENTAVTPRSALREVGNRVPGIGHSSPTLATPAGRRGTPASVVRSNPHTIPRLVRARTRLPLDF